MARLYAMLTFLIVTVLLFNLAGYTTSTGYMLDNLAITNPENFGSTTFYITIFALIAGIGAAGIVLTFLARAYPESIFMSTSAVVFIPILLLIAFDILTLTAQLALTNTNLAMLVGSPLLICYVLTVVDWWRGKD